MKNLEIKFALEALKKINLSSIKDKAVRSQLLRLSLDLLSANRKLQQLVDDIRLSIFNPVQTSLDEIEKLKLDLSREKDVAKKKELLDKIKAHTEVVEPSTMFYQKVNELLQEEFEIEGIEKDSFIAAVSELDGIDLQVLDNLLPILK